MDIYLSDKFDHLYNCSFYDYTSIPYSERSHPVIGSALLILFFIYEIAYIPSLAVIVQKQFRKQPCYKLMLYMGIVDVLCLIICGFFTGLFAIMGYVYCSSPKLIYILGGLGDALWIAQSDAGLMLGINRCLEMYNPAICEMLFGGYKTHIWLLVPTLHAIFLFCFTKPIVYNSMYISWFFNPHFGYYDDVDATYTNIFHTIHNCGIVSGLVLLYTVFLIILIRKSKSMSSEHRTESQRQSFLQVFIICCFNATGSTIYVIEQFFAVSKAVIVIGSFAWCSVHGCPSIIYLVMNKTIRKHIKKMWSRETTPVNVTSTRTVSMIRSVS